MTNTIKPNFEHFMFIAKNHIPFLRLIAVVALTVLITYPVFSQNLDVIPVEKRDGLASNFIYDLEIDSNNLIWIATNNGIDVYNGKTIRNFSIDDGLATNFATVIEISESGNVWIGHNTGEVSHFDGIAFTVNNFGSDSRIDQIIPLEENGDLAIVRDNSGAYYLISEDSVKTLLDSKMELPNKLIDAGNGVIYSIYADHVMEVNEQNWTETLITETGVRSTGPSDENGVIYTLGPNGLSLHSVDGSRQIKTYGQTYRESRILSKSFWMDDGIIWSVYQDSLFQLIHAGDELVEYQSYSLHGLPGLFSVTDIVQSENYLTIATKSNGIYQIMLPVVYNYPIAEQSLRTVVSAISTGQLIIGDVHSIEVMSNDGNSHWVSRNIINTKHAVAAISGLREQQFFFATEIGEIYQFKLNVTSPSLIGKIDNHINHLYVDSQNRLWVSTLTKGVYILDTNGNVLDRFDTSNRLSHNYIKEVYEDKEGGFWLLTEKSKLTLLKDNGTRYFGPQEGLKNSDLTSIIEDNTGQIWLSTDDGRLMAFIDSAFVTQPFSLKDMKSRILKLFQHDTSLIAIANNGVYWLNPKTGESTAHRIIHQSKVINEFQNGMTELDSTIVISNVGKLWFIPKKAPKTDAKNTPWVKHWKIDGELSKDIDGLEQAHIRTLHANIESYQINETRPYWIRLMGIDSTWIGPTTTEQVTFTNLSYGQYQFDVGFGTYNEPPIYFKSYSFSIQRPFYAQWWFYLLVAVAFILLIRAIIYTRTRHLINERNKLESEVQLRTEEINEQRQLIEHKNEEILASINYASRIQSAILPSESEVNEKLPANFILYLPKDIVAGDFYWLSEVKSEASHMVFVAGADCTGHGVPGAMVSVVCSTALNKSIRDFGLTKPSEILDKTRELVIKRFSRGHSSISDGMDIALCGYDKIKGTIQYAGAYNSLLIVSANKGLTDEAIAFPDQNGIQKYMHEIKADKQPIGKYSEMKPFTNHELELNDGDLLYMYSDGYVDQFGGPRGKKLRSKAFKLLIQEISHLEMQSQSDRLKQHFDDWKGKEDQVDDVCVIGMKM